MVREREDLEARRVLVRDPDHAVGAVDLVGVAAPFAARGDDAQGGGLADVPAVADDSGGVALLVGVQVGPGVGREQDVGGAVLGDEHADGIGSRLARDLGAPARVSDRPGVRGGDRRREDVGAFQEERALLRVEERVAGVGRQLRRVGLDLGEVRVERRVEGDIRRHAPPGRDAGLGVEGAVAERGGEVVGVLQLVGALGGEGRVDLDAAAWFDALEAHEHRHLAEHAVVVAGHGHEEDLVSHRAWIGPERRDPPRLLAGHLGEPQGAEGDGQLHLVALGGDAAGRAPDRIPGVILALAAAHLVAREVHLHAQRVDEELVAAALVVEGVEDDRRRSRRGRPGRGRSCGRESGLARGRTRGRRGTGCRCHR